jgi:hypothetical protein
MKKLTIIVISLAMCLSICGCIYSVIYPEVYKTPTEFWECMSVYIIGIVCGVFNLSMVAKLK